MLLLFVPNITNGAGSNVGSGTGSGTSCNSGKKSSFNTGGSSREDKRMALCIRVQKNPPRIKAQNLMLSR